MKAIRTAITLPFLLAILTSCYAFAAKPSMLSLPTATSLPTSTSTLVPTTTPSTSPTETPTPPKPTHTFVPWTPTPSILRWMTPTKTVMENGLTWTECRVPNRDYTSGSPDMDFLSTCVDRPEWSANDSKRIGQSVEAYPTYHDLRITIGHDYYETKLINIEKEGCCHYELLKNGEVLIKVKTLFDVTDPNKAFWNIEGKLVWELAGYPSPVIYVNGVNYNEKYQLEGSYFPYEVKGKLIYIAQKNEKFHIVYDEKIIGPEFDEISMPSCCGMVNLLYGNGQYWFVGRREEKKYLVSIQ